MYFNIVSKHIYLIMFSFPTMPLFGFLPHLSFSSLFSFNHMSWQFFNKIQVYAIFSCRTSCQKEAWISCDVFGFARAIEKYGIESYKLNAVKVGHKYVFSIFILI